METEGYSWAAGGGADTRVYTDSILELGPAKANQRS